MILNKLLHKPELETTNLLQIPNYWKLSRSSSSSSGASSKSISISISDDDEQISSKKDIHKKTYSNQIFIPPLDSSCFETEFNLTLLDYIKKLFSISRTNLSSNLERESIKALLVPHSKIKYSGLCSASAYLELTNRITPIKRIILLCTNHKNELLQQNITSNNTSNNTTNKLNIIAPTFSNIQGILETPDKEKQKQNFNKKIKIDLELIARIQNLIYLDTECDNDIFKEEHSFLTQIPFLELIAPDAILCPLIIGNISPNKQTNALLTKLIYILRLYLLKSDTILICSSDLSYINGHIPTKITNNILYNIRRQDNETLQFLYNLIQRVHSRNHIIDTILFMQNTKTCGIHTIYLFGLLLQSINSYNINNFISSEDSCDSGHSSDSIRHFDHLHNTKSKNKSKNKSISKLFSHISCYYTSSLRQNIKLDKFNKEQLIPTPDIFFYENNLSSISSISYASIIITRQSYLDKDNNFSFRHDKQSIMNNLLTEYEKLSLLELARNTLYYRLLQCRIPSNLIQPINSPVFSLHLSVFTSIYKLGNLHVYSGNLETDNDEYTIIDNIKKYIIDTVFQETLFPKVELEDFSNLDIKITILSPLKQITLNQFMTDKFTLGLHGLAIKINDRIGFFLPSVATDMKLKKTNKSQLLDELCKQKMNSYDMKTLYRTNTNMQLYFNEGF